MIKNTRTQVIAYVQNAIVVIANKETKNDYNAIVEIKNSNRQNQRKKSQLVISHCTPWRHNC